MAAPKNKNKSKRIRIIVIAAIAVLLGSGFIYFQTQRAEAFAMAAAERIQTISLASGDISKTISVSGAVESTNTKNVYSQLSYTVKEVAVEVGDTVAEGDVLATLDVDNLLSDITQAENNYANALKAVEDEQKTLQNNIVNASTSLESAQLALEKQLLSYQNILKDLQKAKDKVADPFDPYTYENAISDAQHALERRKQELEDAVNDDLDDSSDFDPYSYENAIKEAKISLDRRKTELADAEKALQDEKDDAGKNFDDYKLRLAITDAETALDRRKADFDQAEANYYNAWMEYNLSPSEIATSAWLKVESSEQTMNAAEQAVTDAEKTLERAKTELQRSQDDYFTNNSEAKTDAIDALQTKVDAAKKTLEDAQRAYDKSLSDLEKAKSDFEKSLTDKDKTFSDQKSDKVKAAEKAVEDADRAYQKAVADMAKAKDKAIEDADDQLEAAVKNEADGAKQVESAKLSVKTSENSLSQAKAKEGTASTNALNSKLALDKLTKQLDDSVILSPVGGVITQTNATVGAPPSGVLFVIENSEVLYATAKVKEYNLSEISLGQKVSITTDAAPDRIYDAYISYLSPKAVSAAGSTNVEFEIRADIINPDQDLKIGINAFLEIYTDFKEDVFTLPLSSIATNERGSFVYALKNEKTMETEEIPVTLGLTTSTAAEISGDGLYDGIVLLANPTDALGGSQSSTRMRGLINART
ncbi:MAG: efflux RND transporter periplasmic adaptor subunit [Clostridiales bacterium]|jgi:multidrug efflux pump subunit AcrA (membrane-fusion protein)|nr:efflux RND transporter periplasmic adaptor subunit [Clostridiales bacterium]